MYIIPKITKEVFCGDRVYRYGIGETLRSPFPMFPTEPKVHDFRTCSVCQQNRKNIIESLKIKYNRFPNCCEWHRNLRKIKGFDKNDYNDAHIQCADSLIYCYDHILNFQDVYNWREDIKEYLYMAIYRFGCMPSGYGSALFLDFFDKQFRHIVSFSSDIRPDVKYYVYEILDKYIHPSTPKEKDPIEELLHIYNNWLNSFPFDFPEFQEVKKEFALRTPLVPKLVCGGVYFKEPYYRLQTNGELIGWLNKQSKELFKRIRSLSGIVTTMLDIYDSQISKKLLDIEESRLLDDYIEEENEYLETLEKWYDIQKKRIEILRNQLPKLEGAEAITSFDEAYRRVCCFKNWIENQNGNKILHSIKKLKEEDLQILFKGMCTLEGSSYRFDREVNNGRGPVDFLISKGSSDSTLVEFKLASNSNLERNLQYQIDVYKKASETEKVIVVIFCIKIDELNKIEKLRTKSYMKDDKNIMVIDCRNNKPSASRVRNEE